MITRHIRKAGGGFVNGRRGIMTGALQFWMDVGYQVNMSYSFVHNVKIKINKNVCHNNSFENEQFFFKP